MTTGGLHDGAAMIDTHSLGRAPRKRESSQARNEHQLEQKCPFAFTLRLLGSRWRPAIIWKVSQGVRRYGALRRELEGVSDKMLAQDLADLVGVGLLTRLSIAKGRANIVRYELTPAGASMLPLLSELNRWGTHALSRRGVEAARGNPVSLRDLA
jgi:DNA-binding HxlR family transcriptional regulator